MASLYGVISSFLVLILSHRPLILGPEILQAESLFSAKSLGRVTCHQLIINTPEDCGASARRPVSQALGHHRASCSTDKELPSLWILKSGLRAFCCGRGRSRNE